MINDINNGDNFFNKEFLFSVPNFIQLNDDDEFSDTNKEDEVIISDEEFHDLLNELGIFNEYDNDKNFKIEKELVSSRLKLERELLNFERIKFEREKKEWERVKKLSEEKFQAEKDEFELYKRLQREKMYLETKELIDSCTNLGEFLEGYDKIQDVSE